MTNTVEKQVGCVMFRRPAQDGTIDYGWGNMEYTSSNPNEWRGEDVDWIVESLAKGIGKYPIIQINYLGKGNTFDEDDLYIDNYRGNFFNQLLHFRITYETKVPKTTLKKNKQTIKDHILMECI